MGKAKTLAEILSGKTRFGKLTVLGDAPSKVSPSGYSARCAFVRCDCGVTKTVRTGDLKHGYATSCGCEQRRLLGIASRERQLRHGQSGRTDEYVCWTSMKQRCNNPNAQGYENYGGRGISVCERWNDSFEQFFADMGTKPTKRHSIERIDVNGNYEPSNCKWANHTEQSNNRKSNVVLTIDGVSRTAVEWARHAGIPDHLIYLRLRAGWSHKQCVETPVLRAGVKRGGRYSRKPRPFDEDK